MKSGKSSFLSINRPRKFKTFMLMLLAFNLTACINLGTEPYAKYINYIYSYEDGSCLWGSWYDYENHGIQDTDVVNLEVDKESQQLIFTDMRDSKTYTFSNKIYDDDGFTTDRIFSLSPGDFYILSNRFPRGSGTASNTYKGFRGCAVYHIDANGNTSEITVPEGAMPLYVADNVLFYLKQDILYSYVLSSGMSQELYVFPSYDYSNFESHGQYKLAFTKESVEIWDMYEDSKTLPTMVFSCAI